MSLAVNSTLREAEAEFLETLRARYESEGYTFVIHPGSSDLPDFLASYRPDAVATKDGRNIAIEVKSRASAATEQSIVKIRRLFEGRSDWQFTVAYMGGSASGMQELPVADKGTILRRTREAEQLIGSGQLRAAFVMAWSLLEAALNNVRPEADKRPRTPGTVVQTLAMNGYLPNEMELKLRSLIELRNRIVHGDLAVEPRGEEVEIVLDAVRMVLEQQQSGSFG